VRFNMLRGVWDSGSAAEAFEAVQVGSVAHGVRRDKVPRMTEAQVKAKSGWERVNGEERMGRVIGEE
jgi:hypothetical protein